MVVKKRCMGVEDSGVIGRSQHPSVRPTGFPVCSMLHSIIAVRRRETDRAAVLVSLVSDTDRSVPWKLHLGSAEVASTTESLACDAV